MKFFIKGLNTSITVLALGALLVVPVSALEFVAESPTVYAADESGGYGGDYGGGDQEEVIKLELDKQVWNPEQGEWEDDLDRAEHVFSPNDLVTYRLRYRNAGNVDLDNVEIVDQLPADIDFITGPGSYNSETGIFTYTVGALEKDSGWKSITLDVRVSADLDTSICVENLAWIYQNNEEMDSDEAQICASSEQKVLGAEELPVSGAAAVNLVGFSLILIIVGLILKFSQPLIFASTLC